MSVDYDLVKDGAIAALGAVMGAFGIAMHQERRMTKVEEKADRALAGATKSIENGEAIARLEGRFDSVAAQLDRIEGKL